MIGTYIMICVLAFGGLIWILRRDRISLGLPVAYLALLLLNHLPGAYAHAASNGRLLGADLIERPDAYNATMGSGKLYSTELIETGLGLTVLGVVCFVVGVGFARLLIKRRPLPAISDRTSFAVFCLLGGWFVIYGLSPLSQLPSFGAAIVNGGAIWILGVVLGLRTAMDRKDLGATLLWAIALMVYPIVMLVLGGFLSYGTTALVAALSVLTISARRSWKVVAGLVIAVFIALNVFVNYFESRDDIRRVTWGGGSISQRIDVNLGMVRNFHLFSSQNPLDLRSLDQRLNQNYFVGLSAKRLDAGYVDYLRGRSVSDAILALVPRAVWPDKPVYGGSPKMVSEMTGLHLSDTTSWGVGQVMEFNVNFGPIGVILGFFGLGWLLGWLDIKAASAEAKGDLGRAILFFLPGVALLQPIGSLVELSGCAAAALVATVLWRWLWRELTRRKSGAGGQGPGQARAGPAPRRRGRLQAAARSPSSPT